MATATKTDVYQKVTDKILEALDAGTVPWHKPWGSSNPINGITGRPYSGINVFLLGLSPYGDPRWLTYKKAQELGGNPRKGEKATFITFWNISKKEDEDGKEKNFFFLKYFNVFNVEQCENLDEKKLFPLPEKNTEMHTQELAESIINGMPNPPKIVHMDGDMACYSPDLDIITLPPLSAFESTAGYYATKFHEMSHSTGHESRLKREIRNKFGCGEYSKEELIAEFGGAFLCASAGITNTIEDNAAYIASWRKVLAMDKKMIVQCASAGQKAADYILGNGGE